MNGHDGSDRETFSFTVRRNAEGKEELRSFSAVARARRSPHSPRDRLQQHNCRGRSIARRRCIVVAVIVLHGAATHAVDIVPFAEQRVREQCGSVSMRKPNQDVHVSFAARRDQIDASCFFFCSDMALNVDVMLTLLQV